MTFPSQHSGNQPNGFTLIELSIVLVIIGLVVGGVLVGRDLRQSAEIRSQIAQIEKYQTATNTFRGKFGGLPGDISTGANYGMPASGGGQGLGDDNGLIEGYWAYPSMISGILDDAYGEPVVFWTDLSIAGLIPPVTTLATSYASGTNAFGPWNYEPASVINQSSAGQTIVTAWSWNGSNYFGLHGTPGSDNNGCLHYPALTPNQAYAIDRKLDDGIPTTGRVTAMLGWWPTANWSIFVTGTYCGARIPNYNLATWALGGTVQTCFDNGGVAGNAMQYSVSQGGGNGVNCTLAFQFQ